MWIFYLCSSVGRRPDAGTHTIHRPAVTACCSSVVENWWLLASVPLTSPSIHKNATKSHVHGPRASRRGDAASERRSTEGGHKRLAGGTTVRGSRQAGGRRCRLLQCVALLICSQAPGDTDSCSFAEILISCSLQDISIQGVPFR